MTNVDKPDTDKALASLKDFQRRTVDYVFDRLYGPKSTNRFLIADEVGLGKTMVARGVVARAIDHLWDKVKRIDIVYICSNASIARQNISRLNVTDQKDFALPSRITLLPTQVHNLKVKKLNFVSFTPGTSFELKSSTGQAEERALLFRLLKGPWELRGKAPEHVLRVNVGYNRFAEMCHGKDLEAPDQDIAQRFTEALDARMRKEAAEGKPTIRQRFETLYSAFSRVDAVVSREDSAARCDVIGDLRTMLATTCLEALEPDLIILDEFQRFKHLLAGDDDAGKLAQELFRYSEDPNTATRVILLSATPYKMYTMTHESADENHYADFLGTIRFLQDNERQSKEFEHLLEQYSQQLLQVGSHSLADALQVKTEIECRLRRIMVRTERLASTPDRDGMLRHMPNDTRLQTQDLHAYVKHENVAAAIGYASTVEFWKSAPYLLNFMDDYHFKRAFLQKAASSTCGELHRLLADRKHLLLHGRDITNYRPVEPANARLRPLMADTLGQGAWKLLWMPPSLPYYRLSGAYANQDPASTSSPLTKRLVFSCWTVVPKVIAALLSYEAERQSILSQDRHATNTAAARKARRPLLRFAKSQDRLTGMPVLSMIYPSVSLARLGDPLAVGGALLRNGALPTDEEVVAAVQVQVDKILDTFPAPKSGPEDEAWYWLSPILMDLKESPDATSDWFSRRVLALNWRQYSPRRDDNQDDDSHWAEHVAYAASRVADGANVTLNLGRKPADLGRVIAELAVGGLGCCCLRALWRLAPTDKMLLDAGARDRAAAIAYSFLSLFNTPETSALIRGMDDREPYWLRVVEYCRKGGLQSVLDEYAHMLPESLGMFGKPLDDVCERIAEHIASSVSLHSGIVQADHIRPHGDGRIDCQGTPFRFRTRFALRFGQERTEDDTHAMRSDQVMNAFNSPFWPFVLATTSVGQEGLDFHPYCHAVVHWNLPSNPVDLEQREGRVHRYKGHAVRKNLARHFGQHALRRGGHADPWTEIFREAVSKRSPQSSDLHPYWVFPVPGGAQIERHVPVLPMSRDLKRLNDLNRSLVAYRMVFGQPRQDDLLAFLLGRFPETEVAQVASQLQINLEPPAIGDGT